MGILSLRQVGAIWRTLFVIGAMIFFSAVGVQDVASAQKSKPGEMWLDIPELKIRVDPNSYAILPSSKISYFQIRINRQPSQVNYGSIHVKINTEAANIVMTMMGTSDGVLCNFDLTHLGGMEIKAGRNSVEVEFRDPYERLHYASYLLQVSGGPIKVTPHVKRPERTTGERYAVIVGISKYLHAGSGFSNLRYADRDAHAFRDFLQSPAGGNFSQQNILALFNEDATAQNLRSALFTFLTKPLPQDLVVLYFAGHGAPDPNDSRNLYLLTYDTDPNDMGGTAFPMWQLQDVFLRILKARRVVTFNDSCHSYGISGERFGSIKQNNLVNQYVGRYASELNRAVITASDVSELSFEDEKWGGGHGVFTYFLLKGLHGDADFNRDGTVTAGELMAYLSQKVPEATGGEQHPRAIPGLIETLPLSGLMVQEKSSGLIQTGRHSSAVSSAIHSEPLRP